MANDACPACVAKKSLSWRVWVDYVARLEQSRAQRLSPSVLSALTRAPRLTAAERSHLFRLAGHAEPMPGTSDRHIGPSLRC